MSLENYLGAKPDFAFPGAAGKLQVAGDRSGLVRELGNNYTAYHAAVADQWRAAGGRPEPLDYQNKSRTLDLGAYASAGGRFDALLRTESFLRWCAAKTTGSDAVTEPLISLSFALRAAGDPPEELPVPTPLPTPGPGYAGVPVPPTVPDWDPRSYPPRS